LFVNTLFVLIKQHGVLGFIFDQIQCPWEVRMYYIQDSCIRVARYVLARITSLKTNEGVITKTS